MRTISIIHTATSSYRKYKDFDEAVTDYIYEFPYLLLDRAEAPLWRLLKTIEFEVKEQPRRYIAAAGSLLAFASFWLIELAFSLMRTAQCRPSPSDVNLMIGGADVNGSDLPNSVVPEIRLGSHDISIVEQTSQWLCSNIPSFVVNLSQTLATVTAFTGIALVMVGLTLMAPAWQLDVPREPNFYERLIYGEDTTVYTPLQLQARKLRTIGEGCCSFGQWTFIVAAAYTVIGSFLAVMISI